MSKLTVALKIEGTAYEPFVMTVPKPDHQDGENDTANAQQGPVAHLVELQTGEITPDKIDFMVDIQQQPDTGDPHDGDSDSITVRAAEADPQPGFTGNVPVVVVEPDADGDETYDA